MKNIMAFCVTMREEKTRKYKRHTDLWAAIWAPEMCTILLYASTNIMICKSHPIYTWNGFLSEKIKILWITMTILDCWIAITVNCDSCLILSLQYLEICLSKYLSLFPNIFLSRKSPICYCRYLNKVSYIFEYDYRKSFDIAINLFFASNIYQVLELKLKYEFINIVNIFDVNYNMNSYWEHQKCFFFLQINFKYLLIIQLH